MNRVANWLDNSASAARLLAAIAASTLIVLWLIPWSIKTWMPGHAGELLDLKFAYSADVAAATIANLGDSARAGYRLFAITVDLIWPIAYTLQFAWIIALLKRKTQYQAANWPFYPIILMFVLDLLENWTVALQITIYPSQITALGWATSAFTTCKWLSFIGTFAVLFWILAAKIKAKFTRPIE